MSLRRASPLLVASLLAMAAPGGCDCTNTAEGPLGPACFVDADCAFGQACRDGACVDALPIGEEGEGEEGEGEGEGEGDDGEGEGEGEGEGALLIAPDTLALPVTVVGGRSEGVVQLVNVGDASLRLSQVSSSDRRFFVAEPGVGATLPPATSQPMRVIFTADVPGEASAVITVAAPTASGTATATLTVTGSATPDTVDGVLVVRAGPDDAGVGLPDCACSTTISPANVDLVYEAPSASCHKPADISCGIDDSCAPCDLGAHGVARWRSGRTEQPRTGDAPWIVDEEIAHQGPGADGEFVIKATLVDDCTTTVASIGSSTNHTCCAFIDCPDAQACYPYQAPVSCSTDCEAFVTSAMIEDCMARGPVLVRSRLTIDDVQRDLCLTMTRGQTAELARVRRTAGAFSITSLGGAVDEVAPGTPCP